MTNKQESGHKSTGLKAIIFRQTVGWDKKKMREQGLGKKKTRRVLMNFPLP